MLPYSKQVLSESSSHLADLILKEFRMQLWECRNTYSHVIVFLDASFSCGLFLLMSKQALLQHLELESCLAVRAPTEQGHFS